MFEHRCEQPFFEDEDGAEICAMVVAVAKVVEGCGCEIHYGEERRDLRGGKMGDESRTYPGRTGPGKG